MKSALLLAIAAGAAAMGSVLLLWFLIRGLGRLFDRPRIPRAGVTYFFFGLLCAVSLGVAAISVNLARLFEEHTRVLGPTRLGELRCEPLEGGRVRTTFVPRGTEGRDGETVEEAAPTCRIEAAVVTMRTLPPPIGVVSLSRVTQVGHKPVSATGSTLWAPQLGQFPLGIFVREAKNTEASASPDEKTVWAVVATPAGLVLERSGG
jgi:hypothetical protein